MKNYKEYVAATLIFSIIPAFVGSSAIDGCSTIQAAFPVLDKVEQIVVNDLIAGKTPEQIEADVATLLCGGPDAGLAPICVDAVVVVNDVISVLLSTGVLAKNPVAFANAQKVLSIEHAKIAARMGGK